MPFFTKEQIAKAREPDLLAFLQRHDPQELVQVSGTEYCTRTHDSLRISNGKWFWWSRGFGGVSALDYLVKVKGILFTDAVALILGQGVSKVPEFSSNETAFSSRKLLLPDESPTHNVILRYLIGRGIDREIL